MDSTILEYDDDILIGPVTKREILLRLKYRNLLIPKLLEPLKLYEMDDPVDAKTISFYEEVLERGSYTFTDSLNEDVASQMSDKLVLNECTSKVTCATLNNLDIPNKLESREDNISNIIDIINSPESSINNESLNDTLEEMEMLMKFGINYMAQEHSIPDITKNTEEKSLQNTPKNTIEVSETSTQSHLISTPKIAKPERNTASNSKNCDIKEVLLNVNTNKKIENCNIENITTTPKFKSNSPIVKSSKSVENNFKIPVKPACTKTRSPQVKNILSPIGLYIKNSPTVPLIRNVLPTRTYQPAARKVLLSSESEPALPSNVRKLIKGPLNPEIIKHVRRIKTVSDSPGKTNNFKSADMSGGSCTSDISETTFSSEDVSVLISKNATKTNTLKRNDYN